MRPIRPGSAGFIAQVARRYRFGLAPWARMGMPLLTHNARMYCAGDVFSGNASFRFEPRIHLAVERPPRRVERAEPGAGSGPAPATQREPRFIRPAGLAATQVAEVLRRRETRIEAVPRPAMSARESPSPSGTVLPPPALPLANGRAAESRGAPRDLSRESPRLNDAPVPRPAPQPVPPVELARITDAVMSTLNRRLAAERERLGRR